MNLSLSWCHPVSPAQNLMVKCYPADQQPKWAFQILRNKTLNCESAASNWWNNTWCILPWLKGQTVPPPLGSVSFTDPNRSLKNVSTSSHPIICLDQACADNFLKRNLYGSPVYIILNTSTLIFNLCHPSFLTRWTFQEEKWKKSEF